MQNVTGPIWEERVAYCGEGRAGSDVGDVRREKGEMASVVVVEGVVVLVQQYLSEKSRQS